MAYRQVLGHFDHHEVPQQYFSQLVPPGSRGVIPEKRIMFWVEPTHPKYPNGVATFSDGQHRILYHTPIGNGRHPHYLTPDSYKAHPWRLVILVRGTQDARHFVYYELTRYFDVVGTCDDGPDTFLVLRQTDEQVRDVYVHPAAAPDAV
jgi:hypothetical protein